MERFLHLPARGMALPMLKRLEIARALATQPKLVLLDEVVAGLPTAEAIQLASADGGRAWLGLRLVTATRTKARRFPNGSIL